MITGSTTGVNNIATVKTTGIAEATIEILPEPRELLLLTDCPPTIEGPSPYTVAGCGCAFALAAAAAFFFASLATFRSFIFFSSSSLFFVMACVALPWKRFLGHGHVHRPWTLS